MVIEDKRWEGKEELCCFMMVENKGHPQGEKAT